jgi:hypothetical protein
MKRNEKDVTIPVRADNSGRRREESGRKSREGTTEVGETGLYSHNVKGVGALF